MPQHDYDILVKTLRSTLKDDIAISLSDLEQTVSHTSIDILSAKDIPQEYKSDVWTTYLDAQHEDSYLAHIDAIINGDAPPAEPTIGKPVLSETTVSNPVSVYNWLRKHKPDVFLQDAGADKDKSEDKPAKTPGTSTPSTSKRESRGVKRTSMATELLDDEGNLIGGPAEPISKPKRKRERDVDDAYKPKGGGSSSKRRKKSLGKVPAEGE